MLTRRCLLLLFLLASSPARAVLLVGPEIPISNPSSTAAAGHARAAAIVTAGGDFVVFWVDATPGREGLYATRISNIGLLPTGAGFPIRAGALVTDVSACWTGSAYVVTWTDSRAGGVMISAIDSTASIRLIPPRLIPGPSRTYSGALAWNGSRALLACGWGTTGEIRGTLIDAGGQVLSVDIGLLAASLYSAVHLVSREGKLTLFWLAPVVPFPNAPVQPAIVATHVSETGPVNRQPMLIGLSSNDFAVAAGPADYAAVTSISGQLRRYRADDSLRATEVARIPMNADTAGVMWDGRDFIAYWSASAFLVAGFASDEVQTIVTMSPTSSDPLLGWNGNAYLAAWTNGPDRETHMVGGDIAAIVLASDRTSVLQSLAVSAAPGWQDAPRIAHAGDISLVVWSEKVSDAATNQVAVRIGPTGHWLDPAPFLIAKKAGMASVVAVGSDFLVVYPQEDVTGPGIYLRRVASSGTVDEPLRIGSGFSVAAASNGTTALVVFLASSGIEGVRVDGMGNRLDIVPLAISRGGLPTSVASNGTDFLVVWNEGSDFGPGGIYPPDLVDVYAARVFATGVVDVPIAVATGPKDQKDGFAASDGRDYLVGYFSGHLGGQRHLITKRILREGQLAGGGSADDGQVIDSGGPYDTAELVAFGDGYLIAWETATESSTFLRLVRTDRNGVPAKERELIAESRSPYFQMLPAMASFDSLVQLVYGRLAGPMRVFVRGIAMYRGKERSVGRSR